MKICWFLFASVLAIGAHAAPVQNHQLRFQNGKQAFSNDLATTSFANGITMEGWFFFDAGVAITSVFGLGEISTNKAFVFERTHSLAAANNILNAKFIVQTANGNSVLNVSGQSAVPTGAWVHLAISYDNQAARLFQNGVQVAQANLAGQLATLTEQLKISRPYNDGFFGFARELRVWNRGLSAAELLAASQAPVAANSNGLVANWQLNLPEGEVVLDPVRGKRLFLGMEEVFESASFEPLWHLSDPYYEVLETYVQDIEPTPAAPYIGSLNAWGVADFNQDGYQDFIYNGPEAFSELKEVPFRIFLNDRSGKFTEATSQVIEGTIPTEQHSVGRRLVVADLNGDGFVDVYSGNQGLDVHATPGGSNTLLLSNGQTGKLQASPGNLLAPPCTRTTPAFIGQSACSEQNFFSLYPDESAAKVVAPIASTHSTTHGDIDNDGDIDIYVGVIGTSVNHTNPYFLINDGRGKFTADWQKPSGLASNTSRAQRSKVGSKLADMDGDGFLDLILASNGETNNAQYGSDLGKSYIVWGDGSGNYNHSNYFTIPLLEPFVQSPSPPLVIDIDQDRDLDLVLPRTSHSYAGRYLQALENLGGRKFADVSAATFPDQATTADWVHTSMAIDFDGNDCKDILLSTDATNQEQGELIWISNCDGSFSALPNAVLGKLGVLMPLDADNDGDLDFITGQRKVRNVGSNPFTLTNEFALLRLMRPLDMKNIFSLAGCSSSNCPARPETLNGYALLPATTNTGAQSSARFSGAVTLYTSAAPQTLVQSSRDVTISMHVEPQIAHRGRMGQYFAVIVPLINGVSTWYYVDTAGKLQLWNARIADLQAATPSSVLGTHTLEIFEGKLDAGSYRVFAGYRVDGEQSLHFTASALKFEVAP